MSYIKKRKQIDVTEVLSHYDIESVEISKDIKTWVYTIVYRHKDTKQEKEVTVWYHRKMRVEDAIRRGVQSLVRMN